MMSEQQKHPMQLAFEQNFALFKSGELSVGIFSGFVSAK